MNNNKGFTLTEVLLAAMIVGVIGVALAALTTAALRESGVGRVRLMLRNQVSLFVRQLRQDVRESTHAEASGGVLTLYQDTKLGPNHNPQGSLVYTCSAANGTCTRGTETVLNYVNSAPAGSSFFTLEKQINATNTEGAVLRVQLIVGMDNTDPAIKEIIDETIVLP